MKSIKNFVKKNNKIGLIYLKYLYRIVHIFESFKKEAASRIAQRENAQKWNGIITLKWKIHQK